MDWLQKGDTETVAYVGDGVAESSDHSLDADDDVREGSLAGCRSVGISEDTG